MPYATAGGVSRADKSGDPAWIEIDESQYAAALAGMQAGKLVSVDGGFALVDPPTPEEPPTPDPEPEPSTVMSAREFLDRFTNAEYAAVRSSDSIDLHRAYDSLIAAQYVDLTDPAVSMGLDLMVSLSIIDAARRAELLEPAA